MAVPVDQRPGASGGESNRVPLKDATPTNPQTNRDLLFTRHGQSDGTGRLKVGQI